MATMNLFIASGTATIGTNMNANTMDRSRIELETYNVQEYDEAGNGGADALREHCVGCVGGILS